MKTLGWMTLSSTTYIAPSLTWKRPRALRESRFLISPVPSIWYSPHLWRTRWCAPMWIKTSQCGSWTTSPTYHSKWGTVSLTWLSAAQGPCRKQSQLPSSSPSSPINKFLGPHKRSVQPLKILSVSDDRSHTGLHGFHNQPEKWYRVNSKLWKFRQGHLRQGADHL